MAPWIKKNNPFDEYPQEEPEEKVPPSTHIMVECDGCQAGVNIRVKKKDNGHKIVSCHNCLHVIEVDVNNMKSIQVWISNQDGTNRHRATYEKVWQE